MEKVKMIKTSSRRNAGITPLDSEVKIPRGAIIISLSNRKWLHLREWHTMWEFTELSQVSRTFLGRQEQTGETSLGLAVQTKFFFQPYLCIVQKTKAKYKDQVQRFESVGFPAWLWRKKWVFISKRVGIVLEPEWKSYTVYTRMLLTVFMSHRTHVS